MNVTLHMEQINNLYIGILKAVWIVFWEPQYTQHKSAYFLTFSFFFNIR